MIKEPVQERFADTIDHLFRQWDWKAKHKERETGAPHAFSIAISRETGTRGTAIAQEVGRRLNWQVYDHQLVDVVAQDMGVRTKLLESIDERQGSWLGEVFQRAFALPTVSEPAYVHHLARTILALSLHGECVIVGHGAPLILPPGHTLRVRLIAPLNDRIAIAAHKHGKTLPEAKRFVDSTDRSHDAFIKDHFCKDPAEVHQYDLLLNTARYSVDQCAALILQALHDLQANERREPA